MARASYVRSAVGSVVLTLAAAGCWPATGAGPERTAYNGVEAAVTAATAPRLTEAWTVHTDAGVRGVSSPVVSTRGLVHVVTESSVYAVELATGTQRWVKTPRPGTGVVDTEMVVFGAAEDLYVSIDGPSGWENAVFDADDGFWFSEFFGRQEALRASDTRLRAVFSTFAPRGDGVRQGLTTFGTNVIDAALTDHPGDSRLTVGQDLVYHAGSGLLTTVPGDGTEGNGLRAIPYSGVSETCGDPGDAVFACPAWVVPLDGTTATTPVLSADGGTAYVVTDAGTLWVVDALTGAVRWSAPVGAPVVAPPAVAPDAVLVPTLAGTLVAFDPAGCGAPACAPAWTSASGAALRVQPGAATDVVVVGADDGTVSAYSTGGCGGPVCPPAWSTATGSAVTGAPAISLGHVLVGTADGRVIAYELAPG